jgi:hypothetical protein
MGRVAGFRLPGPRRMGRSHARLVTRSREENP